MVIILLSDLQECLQTTQTSDNSFVFMHKKRCVFVYVYIIMLLKNATYCGIIVTSYNQCN